MGDPRLQLMDFIDERTSEQAKEHPFYRFEPFAVEQRTHDVLEQAKADGIDLNSEVVINTLGSDSHPFQDGYCMTNAFLVMLLAGTQTGKSYCAMIDDIIQLTGEVPYSMRLDKGEDSCFKREVCDDNIKRFGRFSISGEFIDKDIHHPRDGAWDCGTIKGVGKYPKEKIAPAGSKIWVCTYKQARDEYWWPRMKKMIPDHLLDKSRGTDGFSNGEFQVYLIRQCEIHFITYEQGYERVEAEKVWTIHLDEEPNDERFFTSALGHCHHLRLSLTPYRGVTWTHEKIFKKAPNNVNIEIYHCSQYDSPYQSHKEIAIKRETMDLWKIGAIVWGLHTAQVGQPYFDRNRITKKMRDDLFSFDYMTIYPDKTWDTIRELFMSEQVGAVVDEVDVDTWEVYEKPREGEVYFLSADTAEGADDPEQSQDSNCAHIFRKVNGETGNDFPDPVHVAAIRTTLPTNEFARLCLYACMYYNNALMAPEAKGFSAGTFIAEVRDYPFMYTMTVINDKTRKPTEKIGFITGSNNRTLVFDSVGEWIKRYDGEPHFKINHEYTLKEASECILGKRSRPDHPRNGSTDCLITFGIGLYVNQYANNQIHDNSAYCKKPNKDLWATRRTERGNESRPVLGSKTGLDARASIQYNSYKQNRR